MRWRQDVGRLVQCVVSPRVWQLIQIARRNRYYEEEFWLLPRLCDRNAGSIDVGGNAGVYAYYLSWLTARVHVFEPNPICLAELAKIRRRNMIIHELALSDTRGQAVMRFDPQNTGIGTIEPANSLSKNPGIRQIVERSVEVSPLDDLGLSNIAFMKIDVEGHEAAVLRGAQQFLQAESPVLLIEIERRHHSTSFEQIEDFLRKFGYTCWRLHTGTLMPVRRQEIDALQAMRPENNPAYTNNFIFVPPKRAEVLNDLC
jgi:FkbM family methyltransferase